MSASRSEQGKALAVAGLSFVSAAGIELAIKASEWWVAMIFVAIGLAFVLVGLFVSRREGEKERREEESKREKERKDDADLRARERRDDAELRARERQEEYELRHQDRLEALESEIRQEKRSLDERMSCEGPSCTTGLAEGRTRHIAAKRDMWDLDGKAVSIECFRSSKRRDPIPGEDKRAFPPRSFAEEQAAIDAKDKQDRARMKYLLIVGLGGSEEQFRADMQDPSRSDEDRLRSKEALEGLLKAKAESGDFDLKESSPNGKNV